MNKILYILFFAMFVLIGCQPHSKEIVFGKEESCFDEYAKNHNAQVLSFPRKVYLDSNTMSDDQINSALESIEIFNNEFDFELFKPILTNENLSKYDNICGSIFMTSNDSFIDNMVGFASWSRCFGFIKIKTDFTEVRVYVHELGHTLNLRHEDDIHSIMYEEYIRDIDQVFSYKSKCLINLSISESKAINVQWNQ